MPGGPMGEGTEDARAAAGRLARAVRALPEGAAGAGEDAREAVSAALQRLAETGEDLGEEALEQLKGLGGQLAGALEASEMEDLRKAAAGVGREGASALQSVWAFLQPAAAAGTAAAGEAASAAADAAAPVLAEGAQAAADSTRTAKGAVLDIYSAPEVQELLGNMWTEVDETYNMGMDEVRQALAAIEGLAAVGLLACCGPGGIFEDLLKGEIFRDSFQALGLFFSQAIRDTGRFVKLARDWMGRLANVVALDFFEVVRSEVFQQITIGISVALALFMIVSFAWLAKKALKANPDSLREGHETKSWKQRKAESAREVRIMGLILTVGTTAYLPISRVAVEILVCGDSFKATLQSLSAVGGGLFIQDGKCSSSLMGFAMVALLLFSLPFPIAVAYAIWRNKPRGSLENPDVTHDEDGVEVPFDDKRYLERCENDPNQISCPYNSLYRGLERRWAFYKVAVMVHKFLMAIVAVTLATSLDKKNTPQAVAMLVFQVAFSCVSFYATPFVDPNNDKMDACGRISAITTAICTLVLALTYKPVGNSEAGNVSGSNVEDAIGLILNIAMAINAVVMVSFVVYSITKNFWKNLLGRFEFGNTVLNTQGPAERIIPSWDLDLEVKHRVWHAFWDSFILNRCEQEVAERMLELKDETRSFGLEKIRAHWEGAQDTAISAARLETRSDWEGVDLFWDDGTKTLDGHLDSKTFFGKLYVSDYPFHIRVIYDDSTDVTFLWENKDIMGFIELQKRDDIVARRGVRQNLRALAEDGSDFKLPFSRVEMKRVADGTRTTTDSEGNKKTETVYSTIPVTMYYTNGSAFLKTNNDELPMQAGFECGMEYKDGYGQGVAPRTGQTKHFSNEHATMGPDHVGVGDGTFTPNRRTEEVFEASQHLLDGALPALLKRHQKYRDDLMREQEEASQILGDGFWFFVYNRPTLSLAHLEHYLSNCEKNAELREMVNQHSEGLQFLYKRLNYCQAHPAFALWYVFWADFWENNRKTSALQGLEARLSPSSPNSIAYLPLPREQLEVSLSEWGLLGGRSCIKRLINGPTLDALYDRMDLEAKAAQFVDPAGPIEV